LLKPGIIPSKGKLTFPEDVPTLVMERGLAIEFEGQFSNLEGIVTLEDMPEWILDERFEMEFAAPTRFAAEEEMVRISEGSVFMSSTLAGTELNATAGQCIKEDQDSEGYFIDALEVVDCP